VVSLPLDDDALLEEEAEAVDDAPLEAEDALLEDDDDASTAPPCPDDEAFAPALPEISVSPPPLEDAATPAPPFDDVTELLWALFAALQLAARPNARPRTTNATRGWVRPPLPI
jgi:hypothetical protein